MDRKLRGAQREISNLAHDGKIAAADLADFTDNLEKANHAGVNTDDIEWLRVIARIQARLDECNSASEFGLPHGNWRDWDIPFDKTEEMYNRMQRAGAVREVNFYQGGNADVRATDLRAIQNFLAMQLRQRLRGMDLLFDEPGAKKRRLGAWLAQHGTAVIVGISIVVGAAIIVAYLGIAGT